MEAEAILIKIADRNPDRHAREIHKASPDDPKHPGWPAGTEGGRGGKFRPKTETETTEELHEAVNAEYSQFMDGTNITKYDWLQTQP